MVQISVIKKSETIQNKRLDAEYYQPKYLEIENKLKEHKIERLGKLVKEIRCGPFGSTILCETYSEIGNVIVARPFNIKNFSLENENLVYIDEKDCFEKNLKFYSEGDIFFSRVGDVRCGVVPRFNQKITISPNIIAVKIDKDKLNPYYAAIFFNSKFGFPQIERALKIVAQPTISTDLIKELKMVLFDRKFQDSVGKIFNEFYELNNKSAIFYKEAEQLLLEELGIDKLDFKKDKPYCTVLANKTIEENRLDAEYYQLKYSKLIEHLRNNFETKYFGELMTAKKGIEPGSDLYQTNGKPFYRVSNLSKFGLTDNNLQYLDENYYQTIKNNFQPNLGEILLSKDATPGIAYVLKEPVEGIISSGILRIKLVVGIEPEYLALLINSVIGKMQIERDAGGSIINHWRPDQIKALIIPILLGNVQKQIADLVQKSHEARKEAKSLLSQAIQKVEHMIEQN